MDAKTENKSPAAASIEFRDAYYAQLDKRVDDWMSKVNNMSLRDIKLLSDIIDEKIYLGLDICCEIVIIENCALSCLRKQISE